MSIVNERMLHLKIARNARRNKGLFYMKGNSKGAKRTARRVAAKINGAGGTVAERRARAREGRHSTGLLPTQERMAKEDVYIINGAGLVEDVLDRLHRTRRLDKDAEFNTRLYDTGRAYRAAVYQAGLSGIGAQALGHISGGRGDPAYMMPQSEACAIERGRVRNAWKLLGSRLAPVVHELVVAGRTPEDVGRTSTNYRDGKQASAAALTMLRLGLCDLSENMQDWS